MRPAATYIRTCYQPSKTSVFTLDTYICTCVEPVPEQLASRSKSAAQAAEDATGQDVGATTSTWDSPRCCFLTAL